MDKKEIKKIVKILLIVILVYWLLNNLNMIGNAIGKLLNILFPFILGGALAFIFNIPMSYFEKFFRNRRKSKKRAKFDRAISIILSILVFVIIILFIFRLVIPQLLNVCELLIEKAPYYLKESKGIATNLLENEDIKNAIQNINIDTEKIKTQSIEGGMNILTSSIGIIGGIFSGITNLIISIIFAVYMLLSKEKIKRLSKKILYAYLPEEKGKNIIKILRLSRDTFKKFITGQCLEACILGTLCALGMLILNIPYAITIGVLVGVTAIVPIVGAFLGVIVGAILIVSVEPIKAVVFIIFFLILQQIEGNLIYPKVVGNSVGLPGLLVLFAVTVGGSLFGIVGMLVGLPIISILYTMLKEDVDKRLSNKHNKENEDII